MSPINGISARRAELVRQAEREQTYPTCLTAAETLALLDAAESARAFIDTTSIFRQRKESRDEFEAMVWALRRAKV